MMTVPQAPITRAKSRSVEETGTRSAPVPVQSHGAGNVRRIMLTELRQVILKVTLRQRSPEKATPRTVQRDPVRRVKPVAGELGDVQQAVSSRAHRLDSVPTEERVRLAFHRHRLGQPPQAHRTSPTLIGERPPERKGAGGDQHLEAAPCAQIRADAEGANGGGGDQP